MKKLLSFLLLATLSTWAFAQIQNPAKWTFKAKELSATEVELILTVKLEPGWHIYSQHSDPNGPIPSEFTFEAGKEYNLVGKVTEPKAHEEYDDIFRCTVRSFSGSVSFKQKIKRNTDKAFTVKGSLYYQLCNDGSCIAPDDVPFTIQVAAATQKATAEAQADTVAATEEVEEATDAMADSGAAVMAQAEEDHNNGDESSDKETSKGPSRWAIFFLALGGGILTMFTPCVFPMIPMTVNFFMHGSSNKRKNRRQAWIFGFSIVFIFAVLGVILTLIFGPESLNFIGTHWIPNLIFFIIFYVFALSFFGLFEIKMPEKWINKSDEKADKGGWLAPFFIALTTVLVSFSCTGPIIGGALVGLSTSTTDRMVSLLTLLGFGIGFALPFTILAMFPQWLSGMKSGGWLNSVKVVFAFLELAFGLKFLSMADLYCGWHLLNRPVYLALWIVIFAMLGFYLLGKIKFKGDDDVKQIGVVRLFLAILDFAFVVYMIPGMFGAPLSAISGFIPPMDTQEFNLERTIIEHAGSNSSANTLDLTEGHLPANRKYADQLHLPVGFEGFYDLDEAKAWAKKEGKPIFIDFTGRNCANCREMENAVWTDKEVTRILNEDYIICSLYADMNSIKLDESEWITDDNGRVIKTLGRKNLYYQTKTYNMNAQPYYVIIDADGNTLTRENFKYEKNVQKFIDFLNEGVANFKKGSIE